MRVRFHFKDFASTVGGGGVRARAPPRRVALCSFLQKARAHCMAAKVARTAVCITGPPRSLFARYPDEVDPVEIIGKKQGSRRHPENEALKRFWNRSAWAGNISASAEHPTWLGVHSLKNHVLRVLTASGGYDLFVVAPLGANNSNWRALEPNTTNAHGEPDRLFVLTSSGVEPDLWYNDSDTERWGRVRSSRNETCGFYFSVKRPPPLNRLSIQNLLHMLKRQADCNEAIRKHSAATGTQYAYKMRLRPDWAWAAPIPELHALVESGEVSPSQILVGSRAMWVTNGQAVNDSFAVGLADTMDAYLDRYPRIHSYPRHQLGPCMWMSETFVSEYLEREHAIRLKSHPGFRTFPVRIHAPCSHDLPPVERAWFCPTRG